MRRAVLLVDGPSDQPLASHIERMAFQLGADLRVVAPDLRRLDPPPGRGVAARLRAVLDIDDEFDLVLVHRDAEAQDPQRRRREVDTGVDEVQSALPRVAIVPVQMTEAWLLVDELAIRRVAGRPNATVPLGLPPIAKIEATPNPKAVLARALEAASGCTGRRRDRFVRDFGIHRRLLFERVDHAGPIAQLPAWERLRADLSRVLVTPQGG